jgi:hypothetical protein
MKKLDDLGARFPVLSGAPLACEPGWYDLLADFARDLTALAERRGIMPRVTYAKSKFARLTVFVECPGATEEDWQEISDLTHTFWEWSGKVCERCGHPGGRVWVRGRVWTLCPTCGLRTLSGR